MVHSDDWVEYKNLIMERLDDLKRIEDEIVALKVQLAVLSTKVVLITTGVALGTSVIFSVVLNYFIKGGS